MTGSYPGAQSVQTFSYDAFAATKRARGFDEVLVREWKPGTVLDTHTHPFAVEALVVAGEMWLTCGGETRHLQPGDTFALPREVPHAERYGEQGTVFWAARRHAPGA
jgi:quercetin dioxygenase-like cupin family protein